jgi:hypothetical protein
MAISACWFGCRQRLLQADITEKLSPIRLQVDTLVPEEIVNPMQSFGKVASASRAPRFCLPTFIRNVLNLDPNKLRRQLRAD